MVKLTDKEKDELILKVIKSAIKNEYTHVLVCQGYLLDLLTCIQKGETIGLSKRQSITLELMDDKELWPQVRPFIRSREGICKTQIGGGWDRCYEYAEDHIDGKCPGYLDKKYTGKLTW